MKILKQRADELVLNQGLATSRSQAKSLIMAGQIKPENGDIVKKAGDMFPIDTKFISVNRKKYVSRGGFKLEGALEDLEIDPSGLKIIDIGASTGGFTDCLLQKNAFEVTAVDVGKGLLDWTLRNNPKVKVVENLNARNIDQEIKDNNFDMAVIDVSFISLTLILPPLTNLLASNGFILAMVKPQFEVGRNLVGKNGVVKDINLIEMAVDKISKFASEMPLPYYETGRAFSKLLGPEGNQEVFLKLEKLHSK